MQTRSSTYREGLISALVCSFWWGIMPIYWHWLRPIDSAVIIFYRIFLVAGVCLIAALRKHTWQEIWEPLKEKKVMIRYIIAGILITANWSIYIWAVNADFVIETCIGYYMEPLMVCIFGIALFKEKLTKYKKIAFFCAFVGVATVIFYYGEVPLIAISLAVTFSTYAAIKKNFTMPPILSLLYETIFLAPFAIGIVLYLEITQQGAIGVGQPYQYALMLLCGLFTAFPLALFANAANKINLFALGLTEYIGPTISLFISIFLFKEPFDFVQLVAFAIIWIGLVFFSYGEYSIMKRTQYEEEDSGRSENA